MPLSHLRRRSQAGLADWRRFRKTRSRLPRRGSPSQPGHPPSVTFIDLSHQLEDGMSTYPGIPRPEISALRDHAASRAAYGGEAEFYFGRVDMPGNVGTYIDAPFHRFREGATLGDVDINNVAGLDGVLVDAQAATRFATHVTGRRAVALPQVCSDLRGKAVLFRSGWDQRWGTEDYWLPGPFLDAVTVARLVTAGVALVGVDFWNVDDIEDPRRPAHTELLRAGILIVEHLCGLDRLPDRDFRFFAPVLRIADGASFPVRAFAEVHNEAAPDL